MNGWEWGRLRTKPWDTVRNQYWSWVWYTIVPQSLRSVTMNGSWFENIGSVFLEPGNKLLQITVYKMETPQFSPKGVNWAMALRFYHIRHFFWKSPLLTTNCFCEKNNTWSRTMRFVQLWSLDTIIHRIVQKVVMHQDIGSNLTTFQLTCQPCQPLPSGRPPVGWGLRPKQFWMGTHSTENLRVRVFLGAFLSKKRENWVVLDSKRKSQSWEQNWKYL